MLNNYVFSWAENSEGEMVHVDSVPRGLQCDCVCPYCHERLMARHGDQREHGFAHHSDNRGANLNICYMVILYKLAEQIVKTRKRIHAPSYYGIFPEKDLEFETINCYMCHLKNYYQRFNMVSSVMIKTYGCGRDFYNLREDDISRLTYVLKTKIQTIQFPTIILQFSRIIVTKESDFIKAYTIRVFLILLYDRNESFIILYIVMQFGHIFTNCP